ncbi:4-(cytidine 5'-diphospho)-2-C-methyl-D-erythritol kinase [Patescibacteria group bacterium]|nr:4-(cytidine 5'-diphospho)-2-C-methyl-D-erythritol kinase [Patescibacteria group bacterium]
MAKFTYKSHAKINLALDIVCRDTNEYHELKTIFQEIPFFDEIEIETEISTKPTCKVNFSGEDSPLINNENNTVTKAFAEFAKIFPIKNSYKINIKKNIPIGAGFGGGSGNAGTFLKVLYDLEVSKKTTQNSKKLIQIALKVGTDVAFFLKGGTAIGTHYGEIIEPLDNLNDIKEWQALNKIIIISSIRANTAAMYQRLDLDKIAQNIGKTEKMIKAIKDKNIPEILKNMHNDFELVTRSQFSHIQKTLAESNNATSILCGSGSSVISFSNTPFDLEELSPKLPNLCILNLPQ